MSDSPPYGFALPPEEERLLRGRPPEEALAWVARAVGPGARVVAVEPLAGGASSAVHGVVLEDAGGRRRDLVLRRFVRADWLAEEPDLAVREARALELVAGWGLPVPALVAVDPDGREVGVPAVLMTRLPGRIDWDPEDLPPYLRALAELLPRVHAVPVPEPAGLPPYRPYPLRMRRPPRWAARPEVWLRAFDVLEGPPPETGRVLVHRDFHPGNVLWAGGRVSGLVDWVAASLGVPEADVGHCRVNLYGRLGREAAARFLAAYQAASGRRGYHPYWDVVAAVGGLGQDADGYPSPEDEAFLAEAVAALG